MAGRRRAAPRDGARPAPTPPPPPAAEPPPATTPAAPLADRLLEQLAGRPQGAELVELADALGEARIRVGGALKKLIHGGQVEKHDRRYLRRRG